MLGKISPLVSNKITETIDIVKNTRNPFFADKKLEYLKVNVAYNQGLNQTDRFIVSSVISIARASNYFWREALEDASNPYHERAKKADATGGLYRISVSDILGGGAGGAIGSFFGPGGACLGAICFAAYASAAFD
jgi:hypothetical protein